MYSALEVARHIVKYCNDHDYIVSNLKLQKLLYFVQAYFLIKSPTKEPCFEDLIVAWDFGPVVPAVYSEFKRFGGTSISRVPIYYDDRNGMSEPIEFADNSISKHDKKLIDEVVEKFRWYTAPDLVKLTHNQAPWKDAYFNNGNKVITVQAMRKYFNDER